MTAGTNYGGVCRVLADEAGAGRPEFLIQRLEAEDVLGLLDAPLGRPACTAVLNEPPPRGARRGGEAGM